MSHSIAVSAFGLLIVLLFAAPLASATVAESDYSALSQAAQQMVDEAFDGIAPGSNIDHHVHVVGIGGRVNFFQQRFAQMGLSAESQGCLSTDFEAAPIYVNPKRFSFFSGPLLYVKTKGLMKAAGVTDSLFASHDELVANDKAIAKLYHYVKGYRPGSSKPGQFVLLAMDGYYDENGVIDWEQTDLLVPNGYVVRLAACMNRLFKAESGEQYAPFMPAISIHPAREDAIAELERYAGRAAFLKWLPNTMNINPASPEVDLFLQVMKRNKITLLTHTGHEEATEAQPEHQRYGNPTLHQQALEAEVKVIMAHAGYRGHNLHHEHGTEAHNTELFNDMLLRYPDDLKGGLSATVFVESPYCMLGADNGCLAEKGPLVKQLERILSNQETLYGCNLVNGSDFPLPAVDMLNPVDDLVGWQLLEEDDADALKEVWHYNPMLFDFVLKRRLQLPGEGRQKLADNMFLSGGC